VIEIEGFLFGVEMIMNYSFVCVGEERREEWLK